MNKTEWIVSKIKEGMTASELYRLYEAYKKETGSATSKDNYESYVRRLVRRESVSFRAETVAKMKIQEKIIEIQEAAIARKKEAIAIGNGKASDILCHSIDQVTAIQIACLLATGGQEAGGIVPDSGAIANETGPEMVIPITNDSVVEVIIKEYK